MIQAGTIRIGSGLTCLGRRRVLDQLDQSIAVDDLAGRDRHVAAAWNASCPTGGLPRTARSQSSRNSAHHAQGSCRRLAACAAAPPDWSEEIGGRDHVEDLP